jgi:hypothetical protein
VPFSVHERLATISDSVVLKALHRAAVRAPSLESFIESQLR